MNNHKKILVLFFIGIFPFLFNGILYSYILDNLIWYWIFEIIFWIIMPISIFSYAINHEIISISMFGSFQTNNILKNIVSIMIVSISYFFIYFVSQRLTCLLFTNNYFSLTFSYSETLPENIFLRYLVIIYHSVTAGLIEEFYYRGLLGSSNLKKNNYILFSSVMFSIVHWENGIYSMLPAFAVGFYASNFYYKNKNLWPLIVGHSITDFVYFLIL